ncbi:flagellar hook-basal body complex protein FliE [Sulfobacillus thermosulfidooxidans]|uniref:flagellar hook-basal body complex protein FliE n=1 Tax=Sulfobacillus thermosulfidooxidans TaxID=28034 RepID=UPI0006B490BB|nr:flagellar hook-basal body complex protein FliE [Sulfobacillus thermosulfidooxidans]
MNPVGLTLTNLANLNPSGSSLGGHGAGSTTFGALLKGAINQLESTQAQANQQITGAMTGQVTITGAMVAIAEAQSTLDVATSIRNNVVQAYQTIMNMSVG